MPSSPPVLWAGRGACPGAVQPQLGRFSSEAASFWWGRQAETGMGRPPRYFLSRPRLSPPPPQVLPPLPQVLPASASGSPSRTYAIRSCCRPCLRCTQVLWPCPAHAAQNTPTAQCTVSFRMGSSLAGMENRTGVPICLGVSLTWPSTKDGEICHQNKHLMDSIILPQGTDLVASRRNFTRGPP